MKPSSLIEWDEFFKHQKEWWKLKKNETYNLPFEETFITSITKSIKDSARPSMMAIKSPDLYKKSLENTANLQKSEKSQKTNIDDNSTKKNEQSINEVKQEVTSSMQMKPR